jgi:tRNA (guanine37-N1)-methyltransferase
MVLMPGPTVEAVRSVQKDESWVVYLTPQGKPLTAQRCEELAATKRHIVLLCGHYEGIDQRAIDRVADEQISIGDYVLTSGCAAAIVFVDALVRFIPGVLGHELSAKQDSFQGSLLDCPHYTRPEIFDGEQVPEVLLSGHHSEIAKWRHQKALEVTQRVRPDLGRVAAEIVS